MAGERSTDGTGYSRNVQSVAEALRAVVAKVPRLGAEIVGLDRAHGRVITADVVAGRALPGFDNSAMDGYAARASELPATLELAGTSAAGDGSGPLPPGRAIRIFTGAVLPEGADTVVIQEDTRHDGERVVLPASPVGDNVRRAGEDISVGERVLSAGTRLSAWDVGVLAALGIAEIEVARLPRIAIASTGDELVEVAHTPGPGQLVASTIHALAARVRELGAEVVPLGIVRDDRDEIAKVIGAALEDCDVVITTGGVSVGDRDRVKPALASLGIELEVNKVALKPGKPFAYGHRDRRAVFGLPGNPVSTLVGFELFVRPALLAMQGATTIHRPRAPVVLPRGYRKSAGRAHYLRARLARDGERLIAHVHPKQGSAMMSSLIGCNALVEIAAELTEVAPDTLAPAILLEAT
jgi:molybdopterin molybdotransferase